jgi:hypothetical protein
VPLGSLAEHLAGLGIEGRIERQGAMTEVLKAVSIGLAWGQRSSKVVNIR